MKQKIRLLLFICVMSMCLSSSFSVFASESENGNRLPEGHYVVGVEYVPYDYFIEMENSAGNQITPKSRAKYIIKNSKKTGETFGDIKYTSDEGVPGVSVGLNRSTSISASCSVTGIAIIKAVSAKLGFNVTASYNVGTSSSWVVPERYNGRKVKYGYLIAKPVFDNWKYDVYIDSNKIDETFLMNGTAKKPRNRMRIEKIAVYK